MQAPMRVLADALQDARFGARMLRRAPLLTAVALATLTLAISANSAIFSLIDPLLFRDLPVREPARLVEFTYQFPRDPPLNMFSLASYERYRDGNHVFSDVFGFARLTTASRGGDQPVGAEIVTGNFFTALGLRPVLGRLLEPSDDQPGAPPVAVLSWSYWQKQFNGDARVLGRSIAVEDTRVLVPLQATVVGVAEREFVGVVVAYPPDTWMSLAAVPTVMRARASLSLIARLKPGASIDQARAEMRVLDQARIQELGQRDPQWLSVPIDVTSARAGLSTPLRQQFGGPLFVLLTMVGGVLLLACVNVGGLLLARGAARQQEMALRISLGAGRLRIARQILTESLLLASIGGIFGVVGARIGATILMRMMLSGTRAPGPTPNLNIALDVRVLGFTVGITIVAALLFGLVVAIAAFTAAPAGRLRPTIGAPSRIARLVGNGLVITQVAISVALLSVSHLSFTHLRHLHDRSLGFDRDRVLLLSVNSSRAHHDVVARLRAIPGVRSVAASGTTPIALGAASRFLRAEGFDEPAQNRRRAAMNWVSPDYFVTYGTPLLAGRDFRQADAEQPRRVIVNQAVARHYFAGRDPIGRRVWLENEAEPYEIVGVVGDAKYHEVRDAAPPTVYVFVPPSRDLTELSLRTDADPATIAADARRVVTEVLGTDAVRRVTTLAAQVDSAVVPERVLALLAGFFGFTAAMLAAIGLYGLLAYTVTRRTKEIGVRIALGASQRDVVRMMLKHAALLVFIGIGLGVPAAFWSKRVAATMVEQLAASSSAPIAVGAVALVAVGLVAAYGPVRRATRIDPIAALRTE